MNDSNALKMAYNVGLSVELLNKCIKVLDSYRRYVRQDQVLNDVLFDLRIAADKIKLD